jgi:hypothetical protein
MHVIHHFLLGVMRKTRTITRTRFINPAFIISKIQKLARLRFIDPIAVTILPQVPLLKLSKRHADMRRYPYHVATGVGGRHSLTTIGT